MPQGATCLSKSLTGDASLWFSAIPMNIIDLVRTQYSTPSVVLRCRADSGAEVTRVISLTTNENCQTEEHAPGAGEGHLYASTSNAGWPSSRGMTVARPVANPAGTSMQCKLIEIDYHRDINKEPLWASLSGLSGRVAPGVCAWLGGSEWMVPCRNNAYELYNNDTGAVQRTSMVFGARTPGWGAMIVSAPDYQMPGRAYFGTETGVLVSYSAADDSVSEHGWGNPQHPRAMTALLAVPRTGQLMVGHGRTLTHRDMRKPSTIAWQMQLPANMWMSSAFVTEYAFAMWNDIVRGPDGALYGRDFCWQMDMRAPDKAIEMPHWKLPSTLMPMAAARVDRTGW